jgi:hypothetical protein
VDAIDQATEVLRDAERKLRDLVAEAALSSDYGTIMRIAGLARSLSELSGSRSGEGIHRADRTRDSSDLAHGPDSAAGARKRSREEGDKYPRFYRRGEMLVRVSWSKREKREYSHRAPLSALKAITAAVAEKGANGRLFTIDDLLPVCDSTDGVELPGYQAYLCVSFFKEAGLLDQHGRSGYSIPHVEDLQNLVDSAWLRTAEQ